MDTVKSLTKVNKLQVLKDHKAMLQASIDRFQGQVDKDHPNDPTGKETLENKIKALNEEIKAVDKKIAAHK
jgi:hypothetical protein